MALGVVAVILAVGGGAYAATSGGGTITACVDHHTGGLYRAHRCARRDKKLSWNAHGPRGPAGLKGDSGSQGLKGDTGSQGPQGLTGDTGSQGNAGDTGSTGVANVSRQQSALFLVAAGATLTGNVPCIGQKVLGGGVDASGFDSTVHASFPDSDSTWSGTVTNHAATTKAFTVWAICANTS
jgi:hypothetical protein